MSIYDPDQMWSYYADWIAWLREKKTELLEQKVRLDKSAQKGAAAAANALKGAAPPGIVPAETGGVPATSGESAAASAAPSFVDLAFGGQAAPVDEAPLPEQAEAPIPGGSEEPGRPKEPAGEPAPGPVAAVPVDKPASQPGGDASFDELPQEPAEPSPDQAEAPIPGEPEEPGRPKGPAGEPAPQPPGSADDLEDLS